MPGELVTALLALPVNEPLLARSHLDRRLAFLSDIPLILRCTDAAGGPRWTNLTAPLRSQDCWRLQRFSPQSLAKAAS